MNKNTQSVNFGKGPPDMFPGDFQKERDLYFPNAPPEVRIQKVFMTECNVTNKVQPMMTGVPQEIVSYINTGQEISLTLRIVGGDEFILHYTSIHNRSLYLVDMTELIQVSNKPSLTVMEAIKKQNSKGPKRFLDKP